MIPFVESSRKCKMLCTDRKQIIGCLDRGGGRVGMGGREGFPRGRRNLKMSGFIILSVMMVSQIYTYVKTSNSTF